MMKKIVLAAAVFGTAVAVGGEGGRSTAPETWFHVIGGNASKEGLAADLDAIKAAGISGIQFFHGQGDGSLWPGVTNPIPCMSEQWVDLVRFASEECHRRGLTFKMQNCPGWSMSGGPWITADKAMRKIIAYEPDRKPAFDAEDDCHEICTLTFPIERGARMMTLPQPAKINFNFCYEPDIVLKIVKDGRTTWERKCPKGCWSDMWDDDAALRMTFDVTGVEGDEVRADSKRQVQPFKAVFDDVRRIDNWQAKAGNAYRGFDPFLKFRPFKPNGTLTLTFANVNMKRRNHPAPPEATGYECDKLSSAGFEANWDGYVGMLLKRGVKVDGLLVDSWECGSPNWTWRMEEEFKRRFGYDLRPWLPAVFGYPVESIEKTERFLLDWRNCLSRLVEENYYGTIARKARESGMTVQYESAFGDVIVGDMLKYWKDADEPMCEFWSPHNNDVGYIGSYDYKPLLPCASAAHIYGKRRVSAESFTSFSLTYDENFFEWKKIVDANFGRGLTHVVFHTFTHNPVVGGKAPGSSFGSCIGSPFLRLQPWWPYLREFTGYLAFCGQELERGHPVIDILLYLGDDVNHRPSEHDLLFDNRYKYDYLNTDALMTRVSVKDGRLAFPDGMSYRLIWIPEGTFLLPSTEEKLAALEKQGARIVRGAFTPDWPSPLRQLCGLDGKGVHWYQRRDGDEDIFFTARKSGESAFSYFRNGKHVKTIDAVTRQPVRSAKEGGTVTEIKPEPVGDSASDRGATLRAYACAFEVPAGGGRCELDLGDVRHWATVSVNGREAARLWCPPYACDISGFVKPGENKLRVEVTTTIYNRLAIDAGKPENERTTWTLCGPGKGAPLHESGLLGPVTLRIR